jgi:hypothetical protein
MNAKSANHSTSDRIDSTEGKQAGILAPSYSSLRPVVNLHARLNAPQWLNNATLDSGPGLSSISNHFKTPCAPPAFFSSPGKIC